MSVQEVVKRKKRKIVKTGIAFPQDVLIELDEIARKLGIPNRSKAVVEAIIGYINDNAWIYENGIVAGALCIIYEDARLSVPAKLLDIRNTYSHIINVILHLSLDSRKSMDIWVVEGPVRLVKRLVEALERVKGTYMVRTIVSKRTP